MRCNNCGWVNPDGQERCQKCNQKLDYSLAELESVEVASVESEGPAATGNNVGDTSIHGSDNTKSAVGHTSVSSCSQCGYPIAEGVTECPMCGCVISNTEKATPVPQDRVSTQDEYSTKATVVSSSIMESIEKEAALKMAETKQTVAAADDFKKTIMDVNANNIPHIAANDMSKTVRDMGMHNKDVSRLKQTVRDISPSDFLENHPQNAEQPNATQEQSSGFTLTPIDGFGESSAKLQFAEESVTLNRGNVEKDNAAIDVDAQLSISFDNGEWYVENQSGLKNTYIVPVHKTKIQSGDIIVIGNRRYIFE